MKPIIWSFGGGRQSTAIAVLISRGKLPVPERAIIADTGRENSATWTYLDNYVRPLLSKVGLEVEVAPHSLATVDLYSIDGKPLIPAWTAKGQMSTFCSNEWKKRVVRRFLTSPERGYGKDSPIIEWLGFSRDEISRCKTSDVKWIESHFPLIMNYGFTLTKKDCVRIVEEAGLPTPEISSCCICPFKKNAEWQKTKANPKDWEIAVTIDREMREKDPLGEGLYLHFSRVPLEDANLADEPIEKKHPLFAAEEMACTSGVGCWT